MRRLTAAVIHWTPKSPNEFKKKIDYYDNDITGGVDKFIKWSNPFGYAWKKCKIDEIKTSKKSNASIRFKVMSNVHSKGKDKDFMYLDATIAFRGNRDGGMIVGIDLTNIEATLVHPNGVVKKAKLVNYNIDVGDSF